MRNNVLRIVLIVEQSDLLTARILCLLRSNVIRDVWFFSILTYCINPSISYSFSQAQLGNAAQLALSIETIA